MCNEIEEIYLDVLTEIKVIGLMMGLYLMGLIGMEKIGLVVLLPVNVFLCVLLLTLLLSYNMGTHCYGY